MQLAAGSGLAGEEVGLGVGLEAHLGSVGEPAGLFERDVVGCILE